MTTLHCHLGLTACDIYCPQQTPRRLLDIGQQSRDQAPHDKALEGFTRSTQAAERRASLALRSRSIATA